jgi:SAM-dependent methyltransferase
VARQPKHWKQLSWEAMAQENPLFAVMTTEAMADAPPADFSAEHRAELFRKGTKLFKRHIRKLLYSSPDSQEDTLVVEYGCGVGRIIRAVAEAGWRTAGIDISPTMLEHCRTLAPQAEALYLLDGEGRTAMPDASASVVFSFAVVQHIASLKAYLQAFEEMCRVLKPGGLLAVQVNCKDFEAGDLENPGRTENHEAYSLHYHPGEREPFERHEQNQWSGVYIDHRLLTELLAKHRISIHRWYYNSPDKLLSVWLVGKKKPLPTPSAA